MRDRNRIIIIIVVVAVVVVVVVLVAVVVSGQNATIQQITSYSLFYL